MNNVVKNDDVDLRLLEEVQGLIQQARGRVFRAVHSELVMLYWNIGKRVQTEILQSDRAEYGQFIITTLANHLSVQFGKGFSRSALSRMLNFYKLFPDEQIVATLSQQLGE